MNFLLNLKDSISKFFKSLVNIGTNAADIDKISYIRLANLNGLIYFVLDLFLAVLFYTILDDIHISLGLAATSFSFLLCSLGFNFWGLTTLSRLSTVSIGSILVVYCAFYLGAETLVAAALLLGAIFPFVYFSIDEKKSIAFCLIIPLLCYALLVSTNYKLGPTIGTLTPNTILWLRSIFFLIPFLGIVVNTYTAVSERENKTKSLQESQALLETIFHALSHDLANPLQSINMITHLAEEKGALSVERIKTISRNVNKMVRIFGNLKNIAKTSTNGKLTLQLKMYPVAELINEAVSSVYDLAASKKIIITYEGAPNPEHILNILVDREAFVYQVLTNFLTNSVKFSDSGQKISISVNLKHECDQLQLVIRDWGQGIERDKLNRIFSWQEKTSSHGTKGELGTGIGLPLALKFLKSMNGDLKLISNHYSECDSNTRGTQVTINLPIQKSTLLPDAA